MGHLELRITTTRAQKIKEMEQLPQTQPAPPHLQVKISQQERVSLATWRRGWEYEQSDWCVDWVNITWSFQRVQTEHRSLTNLPPPTLPASTFPSHLYHSPHCLSSICTSLPEPRFTIDPWAQFVGVFVFQVLLAGWITAELISPAA